MTDAFTSQAQQSWLAGVIPKEKMPAVLALIDEKEEVLKRYFEAAVAYCNQQARISVSTLDSNISSAASTKSSIYPSGRTSLASAITNYSIGSAKSTEPASESARGRPPLPAVSEPRKPDINTHTRQRSRSILGRKRKDKAACDEKKYVCPNCNETFSRNHDLKRHRANTCGKYICPTCNASFGKSHGLKEHINTVCESQTRHLCHGCQHVEKDASAMAKHRIVCEERLQHAVMHSSFDLPPKKAFGCPHCGNLYTKVEEYSKCVAGDQTKTKRPPALASFRVKALLQQDDVVGVVQLHCRKLGLKLEDCEWDDANASWFAERLEYGCIDPDDFDEAPKMGIDDVDDFIKALFDKRVKPGSTPPSEPNEKTQPNVCWDPETTISDNSVEDAGNDSDQTLVHVDDNPLMVSNDLTSPLGGLGHSENIGFETGFQTQGPVDQGQLVRDEFDNGYAPNAVYQPVDVSYADNFSLSYDSWTASPQARNFITVASGPHYIGSDFMGSTNSWPQEDLVLGNSAHIETLRDHFLGQSAPNHADPGQSQDVKDRTQAVLAAQTTYERRTPPSSASKPEFKRPISYDSYNHPEANSRSMRAPARTKLVVRSSPRSVRAVPPSTHTYRPCEPGFSSGISSKGPEWLYSSEFAAYGQRNILDEQSHFSDDSDDEDVTF